MITAADDFYCRSSLPLSGHFARRVFAEAAELLSGDVCLGIQDKAGTHTYSVLVVPHRWSDPSILLGNFISGSGVSLLPHSEAVMLSQYVNLRLPATSLASWIRP
jgi:hypothetical protein